MQLLQACVTPASLANIQTLSPHFDLQLGNLPHLAQWQIGSRYLSIRIPEIHTTLFYMLWLNLVAAQISPGICR